MCSRPEWFRRFDKVHAQARRSLPKAERRWRELDSSMSSDALLMNIFCTPGVADSAAIQSVLGVETDAAPIFGWKARVPLANGRFDRTEVDMRLGSLLVEAAWIAEFVPVPDESTGKFAGVTGSWIMYAYSAPFVLGSSDPVDYWWHGQGTLTYQRNH